MAKVKAGQKRLIMDIDEELFDKMVAAAGMDETSFAGSPWRDRLLIEQVKLSLYEKYGMPRPLSKAEERRLENLKKLEAKIQEKKDKLGATDK